MGYTYSCVAEQSREEKIKTIVEWAIEQGIKLGKENLFFYLYEMKPAEPDNSSPSVMVVCLTIFDKF